MDSNDFIWGDYPLHCCGLRYDSITGRWSIAEQEQEQEQGEDMEDYIRLSHKLQELPKARYKDLSKEDLERVSYAVVPRTTRRAFSSKTDTIYNVFYVVDGKFLDEYCFGDKESFEKNVMYIVRNRWEEHNK